MMERIKNHPWLSLAAIVLVVVLAVLASITNGGTKAPLSASKVDNTTTKITSPFAKVTVPTAINTGLQGRPNDAATIGQYEFFGIGQLPLTPKLSYMIHEDLPTLLAQRILPTYAHTYIHIDRSTIKCDTDYDCALSFYVDSPESYFAYHRYLKPDGSEVIVLQQRPIPGGTQ